jgi:hypothetical protein
LIQTSGAGQFAELNHRDSLLESKRFFLWSGAGEPLFFCHQAACAKTGRSKSQATEHHSLAEASKPVPNGIICLISALRFHDLTTQVPHEVWMAISEKARHPRVDYPPLRIAWFSGSSPDYGVVTTKSKASLSGFSIPQKELRTASNMSGWR